MAALVGSAQPLRYRPTAGDVTMLLAQPANATAEQLSDAAIARGLHLPPSKAAKLAPEAAVAEQVVLLYCNPTRPGCNPTRPGCNPTRLGCSPTRPVCNHMHPGAACARGGQLPPPAAAASHAHRAAAGDGGTHRHRCAGRRSAVTSCQGMVVQELEAHRARLCRARPRRARRIRLPGQPYQE